MGRECYAKSLGDCDGGISREHPLSECVFPDQKVTVSGFDFCNGGTRELHINSLTSKILCEEHNKRLGQEIDWVGGQMFQAVREFTKRRKQQADFPNLSWQPVQYKIDAKKLERWFLKVMLGIGYGGKLKFGIEASKPGEIPLSLVRAAFGLEELPSGQGMYIAFQNNETFTLEDHFRYTVKALDDRIAMGYFLVHGLRFYLNIEPTGGAVFKSIEDSQVFYRQAHFIESAADLRTPFAASIQFQIRRPNAFTQKLSIQ